MALVLPVGVGLALIPWRGSLGPSVSLAMVLPVLAVATLTGPRTGALAGVSGPALARGAAAAPVGPKR